MNLLNIVPDTKIETQFPLYQTLKISTDDDGKPVICSTSKNWLDYAARAHAQHQSLVHPRPIRYAVYDKLGYLDSVYQSGERIVSRCED